MLKSARAFATLPVSDREKARAWYSEKLGLEVAEERPEGLEYVCGDGTRVLLFVSTGKANGEHTQLGLDVDDVDAAAADLKGRGVTFEQYDLPEIKTDENGIAEVQGERGFWFKDLDGNLIGVGQRTS